MIVVLTGKNTNELMQELHQFKNTFIQEHGNSIEQFDAQELPSIDAVVDAVRSISFLEPRKLVIVRDFSQHKELFEKIENIIAQTAESTDLLLVDPKLDKRTAAYKYLLKHTELHDYKDLAGYDLEKWLIAEAKKSGAVLAPAEARFLIARAGSNQQLLEQEVRKLSLLGASITKDMIIEMIDLSPQSKVFDLLDALFSGKLSRAWELYQDQRSQGEEPQKIMAMMTWQLSQLTIAVYAEEKSKTYLITQGISPYSADKLLAMGKRITKDELKYYIANLAEIDAQTKTSAAIDSALETYFSLVAQLVAQRQKT